MCNAPRPRVRINYICDMQMNSFWLCFIPLFVAVDAFGVLPMFIGLTEDLDARQKRLIVIQSVITALVVGLAFLFAGQWLLSVLGITIADFMIAGGTLLFVMSIHDLIVLEKRQRVGNADSLGAVPIGVPLIVGPAVLTTGILLIRQHGIVPTTIAMGLNIAIAGAIFWFSDAIAGLLGKNGAKVISKLATLLLAAFGVMMVRKGIMQYLV